MFSSQLKFCILWPNMSPTSLPHQPLVTTICSLLLWVYSFRVHMWVRSCDIYLFMPSSFHSCCHKWQDFLFLRLNSSPLSHKNLRIRLQNSLAEIPVGFYPTEESAPLAQVLFRLQLWTPQPFCGSSEVPSKEKCLCWSKNPDSWPCLQTVRSNGYSMRSGNREAWT
jgi:hypothetical protein